MWRLEIVISVDILMAKVNWEEVLGRNGVLCVLICVCVFGDIFYSCEIAASKLSRGHCFRTSRCQSMVGKGLVHQEM